MKHLIALSIGILIGVMMFAMGLFYNPFTSQQSVSPLAITNERIIDLAFTAVPGDAILFTNDGESTINPHPARVADLWEPAILDTTILVTTLQDSRGEMIGIGIKTSTKSEGTQVLYGKALVNSAWHVYVPGQGTLLVDQSENYWSYLREIVLPARWNSGDNWKGSFHGITTAGPGALGTARVSGGSGIFAGLSSEAVESLTAKAYSAIDGPVSMNGNLTITLPAVSSQTEQTEKN